MRGGGGRAHALAAMLLAALGSTASLVAQPASTQPVPPVSATQPAASQPSAEAVDSLTVEAMAARAKQIEAASNLDEAARAKILDLYKQAQSHLLTAKGHEAKAAEFEKARLDAPDQLAAIRDQLAARATSQPASAPAAGAASRPATQPAADETIVVTADETGKTLKRLEQDLATAEAERNTREKTLAALADEASARKDRMEALPPLISNLRKELDKLSADLATPAEGASELVLAQRAVSLARKRALDQEIRLYESESRSLDARGELLTATRDLARLEFRAVNRRFRHLQRVVLAQRKADAERQQELAKKELDTAPLMVREIAQENVRLADERANVEKAANEAAVELKDAEEKNNRYRSKLGLIREQVGTVGLTDQFGQAMRKEKSELPDGRKYERRIRARKGEAARIQLEIWNLEPRRDQLADIGEETKSRLDGIDPEYLKAHRTDLEKRIRDLLSTQRASLESLISTDERYKKELGDLNKKEQELVGTLAEITRFIDENIFWVRSTNMIHTARAPDRAVETLSLGWLAVVRTLFDDARRYPVTYIGAAAGFLALLAPRRRMHAAMATFADQTSRVYEDRFRLTLWTLVFTLVLAAFWPLVLSFLAWRLAECFRIGAVVTVSGTLDSYEAVAAMATALNRTAGGMLMLALITQVSRSRGLASAHFRWRAEGIRCVRRNLIWLVPTVLPAVFVIWACEGVGDKAWRDTVGRSAFVVAMSALALFLARVLRPRGGVLEGHLSRYPGGWLDDLKWVWYPGAVGVPLAFAAAACLGYYYTALQLEQRLMLTLWLVLLLLFLNSLMVRYLLVAQRRIAIDQVRKKREAESARAEEATPADDAALPQVQEADVDLSVVHSQTRRLLRSLMVAGLVLGLYAIWVDILPAFAFLNRIELWSHPVQIADVGEAGAMVTRTEVVRITLAHLGVAVVIFALTVLLGRNLPGLLEVTVLQRLPLTHAGRYAITAVARYVLVVIGLVAAFGTIGIGWSQVQWLAAAITVGLGFGLQEIFANFVSGLIILFEQPIRVGDKVTVADRSGTVSRIRIRATTIVDWDRKEVIIPNKEFVTGRIVNWTLTDSVIRLGIPVGVAYGSNVEQVRALLVQAMTGHPSILEEPAPKAFFIGFSASAMDFELSGYVRNADEHGTARHEILAAIERLFREARIEFAFPRLDVQVRESEGVAPSAGGRAGQAAR